MFICNECGEVFEEAKVIEERHPYGEGYATEEWFVCPHCGDSHIEEAKKCSRCDEYVADSETTLGEGLQPLCRLCHEKLYG